MNRRLIAREWIAYIMLLLVALYVFNHWVGYSLLDPANVAWLYERDYRQNLSAINLFRTSPWHFPLGVVSSTDYPVGSNIIFMDGNLLLATLTKLLTPTGKAVQPYGWWILFCLCMQFTSAYWLLRNLTTPSLPSFLGALLIGIAPIFFFRIFHLNLLPHFLIIIGWGAVLARDMPDKRRLFIFLSLIFVSISTHFYFTPPLVAMALLSHWNAGKFAAKKDAIAHLAYRGAVIMGFTAATMFATGYFQKFTGASDGFGFYSMNLNAFINPMGTSSYLMTLPNGTEGQYEGYQYLGLGAIICLLLCYWLMQKGMFANTPKSVLYFWAFIILFSLSNRVYLGSGLIFGANLPEWLMKSVSPFRSSGRYAWFVIYPVLAISFTNAHSYIKDKFGQSKLVMLAFSAAALCLATIQYQDIKSIVRGKKFDVLPLAERVDLKVAKAIKDYVSSTHFIGPIFIDVSDTNTNKDLFTSLTLELVGEKINISPAPNVRENIKYTHRDHIKDTLDAGGLIVSHNCHPALATDSINLIDGWCLLRKQKTTQPI
ncbi:MAG TPA: DUF6311 domain-containing protein [Polaromonas sp.]|nr:DUF6311 domain-containing protein [Polaromonas sp.]